ncbi:MAG TPA: nitroreductase family protein [Pseudonocardiaceae bacterium]|jgi:nitroreductase|nr:nitroreductase family protein [Pseudonocardiaceae bacterium]
MPSDPHAHKFADTGVPVHPLIAQRWSPRALDPAAEVSDGQLRALFEAARWAASFGNTQPARYLVGRRGDDTYRRIRGVLTKRNQDWTTPAAVLILGAAVTVNEKGDIPYAEYGLALASQNLVLQAVAEGIVAHQMAGFDAAEARREFALPDDVRPVIAIAVGGIGDPERLPDWRRDREISPRTRLPLSELAFTGEWGRPLFDG